MSSVTLLKNELTYLIVLLIILPQYCLNISLRRLISPSMSVFIVSTPKLRSYLNLASFLACTLSMSRVPAADMVF